MNGQAINLESFESGISIMNPMLLMIGDILEIQSIPGRYIVTDNVTSDDGRVLLRMRPA